MSISTKVFDTLVNAAFENAKQAGGGILRSEVEEVAKHLFDDGLDKFPKLEAAINKLPEIPAARRMAITGLLSVMKQRPDILGKRYETLIHLFNEAVEGVAEAGGRTGAESVNRDQANTALKKLREQTADHATPDVAGSLKTKRHCRIQHTLSCKELQTLRHAHESTYPTKRVRRPGGDPRHPEFDDVPGERFPEEDSTLDEGIEYGDFFCPTCSGHLRPRIEGFDKLEPAKSNDWRAVYDPDYTQRIVYLHLIFKELKDADALEYLSVVWPSQLKATLDRFATNDKMSLEDKCNSVTKKTESFVLTILGLMEAGSDKLDQSTKERFITMAKAWIEKHPLSVDGQAASESSTKLIWKLSGIGITIIALLLFSVATFLFSWWSGYSVGLTFGSTTAVLVSMLFALAFVIPLDLLADIIRKFIAGLTGKEVEDLDLNKVKYLIAMTVGQVVLYGLFLSWIIKTYGIAEHSSDQRFYLGLAFVATQALSLVVWVNPELLGWFKNNSPKSLAIMLSGVVVVGIVFALFGQLFIGWLPVGGVAAVTNAVTLAGGAVLWWVLLVVGVVVGIRLKGIPYKMDESGKHLITPGRFAIKFGGGLLAVVCVISLIVMGANHFTHKSTQTTNTTTSAQQVVQVNSPKTAPQVETSSPPIPKTVKSSSPMSKDTGRKTVKASEDSWLTAEVCQGLPDATLRTECFAKL